MIYPLPHEQPQAMPALVVPEQAVQVRMRQRHGTRILAAWVVRDAEAFTDALAARAEWESGP